MRKVLFIVLTLIMTACSQLLVENRVKPVVNTPKIKTIILDKENHYLLFHLTLKNRFIETRDVNGRRYYATCKSSNQLWGCGSKQIISIEQMAIDHLKMPRKSNKTGALKPDDVAVSRIQSLGDTTLFVLARPTHKRELPQTAVINNTKPFGFNTNAYVLVSR